MEHVHSTIKKYKHTYMHAYIHTHVHTYINTYIHTVEDSTNSSNIPYYAYNGENNRKLWPCGLNGTPMTIREVTKMQRSERASLLKFVTRTFPTSLPLISRERVFCFGVLLYRAHPWTGSTVTRNVHQTEDTSVIPYVAEYRHRFAGVSKLMTKCHRRKGRSEERSR
jgi:hypothetical protein